MNYKGLHSMVSTQLVWAYHTYGFPAALLLDPGVVMNSPFPVGVAQSLLSVPWWQPASHSEVQLSKQTIITVAYINKRSKNWLPAHCILIRVMHSLWHPPTPQLPSPPILPCSNLSKYNVILTLFYVTFLLSCLVCVSWSVVWYT